MRETLIILAWWVAFGGTHILLSSDMLRPRLVGAMGEKAFMGFYSLVSFATIIPLFWVYLENRHAGPELWMQPPGTRIAATVLMALGLIMLGAGVAAPAPNSMASKGGGDAEARGITRITRHPVSVAFFMLGLSHCLVMGAASDLAFFGGFCVFTWLSTWHQDTRNMGRAGYAEFRATTSFVPFLAMVLGRQPVGATLREIRWVGVIIGVGLFVGFAAAHGWLFGAPLH